MEFAKMEIQNFMKVTVAALKNKVCQQFLELLCNTQKGYKTDYQNILEEISFIDLIQKDYLDEKFSLLVLQYYLNK